MSLFGYGGSTEEQAHRDAERAKFDAKPLIERNAIRLADLEREWAVLGPMRPITFRIVGFQNADQARFFASDLPEAGFEVKIIQDADGWKKWWIRATRIMEPTVTNVTHWEEWFQMRVSTCRAENSDKTYYAHCIGWIYPERMTPAFSLEGDGWRREGARERAELLFGSTLGADGVLNGHYSQTPGVNYLKPPFHLVPSEFLRKARTRVPADPEPTASSFAQWIYSLYANALGSSQDRDEGKAAEEHILAARRTAYISTDGSVLLKAFPEWQLIHNGMNEAQGTQSTFFTVSDLKVGGHPLRALPDLIYRNQRSGAIIIVEIKHSRMEIPNNLWPNVWGQLWCYSQLEQFRSAPKLTVIGEVWGDAWAKLGARRGQTRLVCLRASVRRDPRAAPYDRFFRTLFDIYRGID